MDVELKAKWVAALRSGKYKQGTGQFRDDHNNFCCLGVLADVLGCEWDSDGSAVMDGLASSYLFHTKLLEQVGITDAFQCTVADMNDGLGKNNSPKSFSEIADYIEGRL